MSKFSEGNRVKNIRTGELGYVVKVLPPHRNIQMYRVKYDERELENNERSANLMLDVNLSDPFERMRQNLFGHYTEYLKDNTSFKIKSSNNSTISSLKASKTLFKPYQFKPLLKFLNSDNKRILIADEVGLGKTIEAGHIMLELKARGEFRNALVVCPMALKEKWATELNDKFGLDFINIENKDQLIHELRHHPGYVKAVVNYEKLNNKELISFMEERQVKFSMIVCDESHRLRNSGTQLYKGAEKVLPLGDSVVFMSATPIMLDRENLYNQLHLLEPDIYDRKEVFLNNAQLNEPFVNALTLLKDGVKWTEIKKQLTEAEAVTYNTINDIPTPVRVRIDEYFSDYPIYQEIIKDLSSEESNTIRAKIQYNLAEMSPMSTIFSRTRKTDVTQDWSQAERNTVSLRVDLGEIEKHFFDQHIEQYIISKGGDIIYDEYDRPQAGAWGLVTIKRQLASSIWATISNNNQLDCGIDEYENYEDVKVNALLKIINDAFSKGKRKIIVFAIFKKTIKYLNIRLKKAGYNPVMIYGDSKINKFEVLNQFKFDNGIDVLLSSEVGSEGLDMQFCNCLVNYDLPWNPMVVEQRIGRIDRFGQESPKVNIYNIVVMDTIVEDIFSRLLDRIGIFRSSIGDLEAILDKELEQNGKRISIKQALKSIENDYYSDKLTREEAEKKRKSIEQAIENEKKTIEELEKGLTNTLTNDYYFQNEINKINKNNAYVTSNELQKFIIQLIKDCLTTCSLEKSETEGVYYFHIPKSDPSALRRFLNDNIPSDEDSKKLFASYLSEIRDSLDLRLTFDQELAFNNKSLSFINIYHPIIQAGVLMYEKTADKTRRTFFFEMDASQMPEEIKKGNYLLAIFKISVSRLIFDKKVVTDSLYPILYDIQEDRIIEDHELAESFMGKAQIYGRYAPFTEDLRIHPEIIDNIEYDLKDVVDKYVEYYHNDQLMRINNSKKMRLQQTIQYYETRILNLQHAINTQESIQETATILKDDDMLSRAERTLRLQRGQMQALLQRKEDDIEKINRDVQLRVTDEIKSLNLVKIV
jgi:superfamily II DNA or RNA helicase